MPRHLRVLLLTILLLSLAGRLALVFLVPADWRQSALGIHGFNDEPSHFNHVKYIAEHRRLPVQTHSIRDSVAWVLNDFEYYQSPLYYLAAAAPYALGRAALAIEGPVLPRLLAFFLGVATTGFVFLAGRRISRRTGWYAAVFMSLAPAFAYHTSLVSNDALLWLLASVFTWLMVGKPEPGLFRSLAAGMIAGLGIWAKVSFLSLWPVLFLGVLFGPERKRSFLHAWGGLIVALVLSAPVFLRNLELYGDALAMAVGSGPPRELGAALRPGSLLDGVAVSLATFWLPFDPAAAFSPIGKVIEMLWAVILALPFALWLRAWTRKAGTPPGFQAPDEIAGTRRRVLLLWCMVFLAGAGYLWFNLWFNQWEARLVFAGLPAFAVLYGFAWDRLARGVAGGIS